MTQFTAPADSDLRAIAQSLRAQVVKMVSQSQSGHLASALGLADLFVTLYYKILKHDPHNPSWTERDYLFMSNGHACAILYATLAEVGYFPKAELEHFRQLNSRLQGHPHFGSTPGVENTSGPLGQGLSQAAGLALSLKMDDKPNTVYCVTSDGEHQEGQFWEAYLFAAAHKLSNLICLVDRNHIQISGKTEDVLPLGSLAEKIASFGWQVYECDAHSFLELEKVFAQLKANQTNKPSAIILSSTPGKGVSFMENKPEWHGRVPSEEETQHALTELTTSL